MFNTAAILESNIYILSGKAHCMLSQVCERP